MLIVYYMNIPFAIVEFTEYVFFNKALHAVILPQPACLAHFVQIGAICHSLDSLDTVSYCSFRRRGENMNISNLGRSCSTMDNTLFNKGPSVSFSEICSSGYQSISL